MQHKILTKIKWYNQVPTRLQVRDPTRDTSWSLQKQLCIKISVERRSHIHRNAVNKSQESAYMCAIKIKILLRVDVPDVIINDNVN